MRGLKGKTAIVTGGLGDLGFATCVRLVEEGVKVAMLDMKPSDDGKAAKAGASYFQADITSDAQVKAACDAAEKKLGPASILVNCAAMFLFKGLDATLEDYQKMCGVNIAGFSLMTKHAVEQMKKLGGGSVINFSSVSGFIGQPGGFATYNATKFAIRGLTRCWAIDLAPFKIRVNTICPGYFYTAAFENSCRALGLDIEDENKRAAAMHILNRQAQPPEIGGPVAFLASDDASFITGSDMLVDGGYLAR